MACYVDDAFIGQHSSELRYGILYKSRGLALRRGYFNQQVCGIGSHAEVRCDFGDDDVSQDLVIGVTLHNDHRTLFAPAARGVGKPAESDITSTKAHGSSSW
jgi:hypothetical protein